MPSPDVRASLFRLIVPVHDHRIVGERGSKLPTPVVRRIRARPAVAEQRFGSDIHHDLEGVRVAVRGESAEAEGADIEDDSHRLVLERSPEYDIAALLEGFRLACREDISRCNQTRLAA